jgi:hypothetical protein
MTAFTPVDYYTFLAEKSRTVDSMARHGGGFVAALASAFSRADGSNTRRLYDAFPDIITAYGPGSRFFEVTPR